MRWVQDQKRGKYTPSQRSWWYLCRGLFSIWGEPTRLNRLHFLLFILTNYHTQSDLKLHKLFFKFYKLQIQHGTQWNKINMLEECISSNSIRGGAGVRRRTIGLLTFFSSCYLSEKPATLHLLASADTCSSDHIQKRSSAFEDYMNWACWIILDNLLISRSFLTLIKFSQLTYHRFQASVCGHLWGS